jgi:hypothetical protein
MSTIESMWRYVKAFLNPYNRLGDYMYQLAHYMFAARCRYKNVDQFAKVIDVVTTMDRTVGRSSGSVPPPLHQDAPVT